MWVKSFYYLSQNLMSPFDYRNLGCVILERTEDGLYRIGNSSSGRLAHSYTCNQFSISMSQFLTPADVPNKIVTLRQALLDSSLGKHKLNCNCTSGCLSNRCKCKRSNRICNSNCHKHLVCHNLFHSE